jgi:hypothetical protein
MVHFKSFFYNRKSQTASTLTWIVAFVLIFFILAIYFAFAAGLATPKKIETSVKGILSSDVKTQEYQTAYVNSYLLNNLNIKVEYNSKNVSLQEILEGYASKEYSWSEITGFLKLLNKASFTESMFIYSTFSIDDKMVYFYGDDSCVNAGRARVFLPVAETTFKIDVSGSICGFYDSEHLGGESDGGLVS